MIRPPGFAGAAFGTAGTADLRRDHVERARVSAELGIPKDWAFVSQVHSATVVEAQAAGNLGEADSIVATRTGIPVAVATADCVPIVIEAAAAVAVVHAGWRGAAAGVVPATLSHLRDSGHSPLRAAIGPAIGPCCYEVGPEVVAEFPGFTGTTTWGTASVDLPSFLESQLAGLEVWRSDECTFSSSRLYSWRENQTMERQVTVAWLPSASS